MTWEDLLALADSFEPEARDAFIAAIAKLRGTIDIDALAKAIARGDTLTADSLLQPGALAEDLAPLLDVLQTTMLEAGRQSAAAIARSLGASMRFDLTNPEAVAFAQTASARLVTNIVDETARALRAIVTRAFQEGLTARDTAALIRPLIGLTERQAIAVFNYRDTLMSQGGLSAARVDTLVADYAAKQLRQRALMIARTEVMQASNAGQQALWLQAIDRKLLAPEQKRRWIVTPDDRLCPVCRAMRNQVRGMNEPFVVPADSPRLAGVSVLFPPLHPHCRCVIVLVTAAELRLQNGLWIYYKEAA